MTELGITNEVNELQLRKAWVAILVTVYVKPWDSIVSGIVISLELQDVPSETEAVSVSISKEYVILLASVNVVDIASVVLKYDSHDE